MVSKLLSICGSARARTVPTTDRLMSSTIVYCAVRTSTSGRSTRRQIPRRGLSMTSGADARICSAGTAISGCGEDVSDIASASRQQLLETRAQQSIGSLTVPQFPREIERDHVRGLRHVGKDQPCRLVVAPDQPRAAGEIAPPDAEIETIGQQRRPFEFDLGAAGAEIAHDARERRSARIEGQHTAVIDAVADHAPSVLHDTPSVALNDLLVIRSVGG